jgi:hypothetical protein
VRRTGDFFTACASVTGRSVASSAGCFKGKKHEITMHLEYREPTREERAETCQGDQSTEKELSVVLGSPDLLSAPKS